MNKKIDNKDLKDKIIEILSKENRGMSIREIKGELEKRFEIKRSPQIILRHLKDLEKDKKVYEEHGKKI